MTWYRNIAWLGCGLGLLSCGGAVTAEDGKDGAGGGGAQSVASSGGGAQSVASSGGGDASGGGGGNADGGAGGAPGCSPAASASFDAAGLTHIEIHNPACSGVPLYAFQGCGSYACEPAPLLRLEVLAGTTWEEQPGSGCTCLPALPASLAAGESREWVASVHPLQGGSFRWVLAVSWNKPACDLEPWQCNAHPWDELVTPAFQVP